MNGLSVAAETLIYTEPSMAWQIVAAADFNADGKADLLWYNTTTGQVWMVRMNGFVQVADQSVYQEWDLAWGILNR